MIKTKKEIFILKHDAENIIIGKLPQFVKHNILSLHLILKGN